MSANSWSALLDRLLILQEAASSEKGHGLVLAETDIARTEQELEATIQEMPVNNSLAADQALQATQDILSNEALAHLRLTTAPSMIKRVNDWIRNAGSDGDAYRFDLDAAMQSLRCFQPLEATKRRIKALVDKGIKPQTVYTAEQGLISFRFCIRNEAEHSELVAVSEGWCEFLGYRPDEVIGRRIGSHSTQASREKTFRVFPQFVRDGFIRDEFDLVTKHGKVKRAMVNSVIERDEFGNLISVFGYFTPLDAT